MVRRSSIAMLVLASLQAFLASASPALADGGKHAAMIVDANTGAVLHADDADELRHPASLTKMMTLYMTFELLQVGRLKMSDRVIISDNAAAQAPSKLGLEAGESLSVSDAIRALITKSANDVAVALAEKIGGSERNFVRLMNARARELGMSKTTFQNPSGLPDKNQVTTARDMVTLGMRLQDHFPAYYPLFATRSFGFNRATYRNHNTLLNSFQGIDGIKTGYTRMSGFNLVSSVRRGDRHVVGAVFGGSSAASRNAEMRNLLTRALARASATKTRKPQPMLIAKLKAPPQVAERPKRAEAPKFAAAEAPKPFAVGQPLPMAQARVAAAPAQNLPQERTQNFSQDQGAPVDVFKVKRMPVAMRQAAPQPVHSPDETTDMSASETAAEFAAGAHPAAFAVASTVSAPTAASFAPSSADVGPAAMETVIPKTRVVNIDYGDNDVRNGAAASLPPVASVQPPAPVAFASPRTETLNTVAMLGARDLPPAERARPPSSLQAQAAMIPAASAQRVATLQPAAYQTAPAATPRGRFEVQIGAYASIDEAQRALTSAQSRARQLLAGYGSVTHPVQKAGRTMYRARFSGFDAGRASSTCTELRRQAIDCFVMSAE
ncbi:MAG: serine hydrolase [Hyphomicrobium sp.]|nr:serine hydrolase [Hyphomicrobium sp.]